MKKISAFISMMLILSMVFPTTAIFAGTHNRWANVLESSGPIKVYVADITNKSGDNNVDVAKVRSAVEQAFKDCDTAKFDVVEDKASADLIFKGTVKGYEWRKKAPVTTLFPVVLLAVDVATKGKKNWAKMNLEYEIYKAGSRSPVLSYDTQVTVKRPNVPKDKSYGIIYERTSEILAKDMFQKAVDDKQ